MQAFYSDRYVLPLPPGHRFPMQKYALLRRRVVAELPGVALLEPGCASADELAAAHDVDYVERVLQGRLSAVEQRRIGFPWSTQMAERACRSVGATLAATGAALAEGVGANLAGGTHHAGRSEGQGYCVFNDVAVAARRLQAGAFAAPPSMRIAVVDFDVHQGNGTAAILGDDPTIFTLSIHGARNFPFRKERSDLDIELADGTGDAGYLAAVDTALDELDRRFAPQFIFYVAGADAHAQDRLGRLAVSSAGLRERDARLFGFARRRGAPVVVTMAGGYGRDIDVTVDVHFQTLAQAYAHAQSCRSVPRCDAAVDRGVDRALDRLAAR